MKLERRLQPCDTIGKLETFTVPYRLVKVSEPWLLPLLL
jgi:hypothetical protein